MAYGAVGPMTPAVCLPAHLLKGFLAGAVQILEPAGTHRRMAPHGFGGAAGQGAGDVHPVRGFEKDDLGSHPLAVEPAAGGGDRDGVAVAVGVVTDGPASAADGKGQRVAGLDEADLPAACPRRHLDGRQERPSGRKERLYVSPAGGYGERE